MDYILTKRPLLILAHFNLARHREVKNFLFLIGFVFSGYFFPCVPNWPRPFDRRFVDWFRLVFRKDAPPRFFYAWRRFLIDDRRLQIPFDSNL